MKNKLSKVLPSIISGIIWLILGYVLAKFTK